MNAIRDRNKELSLIVNGACYFTANLGNGWVRVGCLGSYCFDFPPGHELNAKASSAATEDEAEEIFDICAGTYL